MSKVFQRRVVVKLSGLGHAKMAANLARFRGVSWRFTLGDDRRGSRAEDHITARRGRRRHLQRGSLLDLLEANFLFTLTVGAKSCLAVSVVTMWLAFRKPTVSKYRHLLMRLLMASVRFRGTGQQFDFDFRVNLPTVNNVSRKTMGS